MDNTKENPGGGVAEDQWDCKWLRASYHCWAEKSCPAGAVSVSDRDSINEADNKHFQVGEYLPVHVRADLTHSCFHIEWAELGISIFCRNI